VIRTASGCTMTRGCPLRATRATPLLETARTRGTSSRT
jgi:hypothetical protein